MISFTFRELQQWAEAEAKNSDVSILLSLMQCETIRRVSKETGIPAAEVERSLMRMLRNICKPTNHR